MLSNLRCKRKLSKYFHTMDIRNIAVIAHVDHGKTTLIDALLKQTNTFRDNQKEMQQGLIMDSNDLERERGITILAKNCAISYKDTKINIIDTPGHADFSGEVERTLGMADGALLIVDAQEGPMPQTRFVLKKAFAQNLSVIVVINKIDKQNADIAKTERRIDDLFLELAQDESQLHFSKLYAIARDGKIFTEIPADTTIPADVTPLLDMIISQIPKPNTEQNKPFKMTVTSLDYDAHLGRILIGKIQQGTITTRDRVIMTDIPETQYTIEKIFAWRGLNRISTEQLAAGDIVALSGIDTAKIGQTISDPTDSTSLPAAAIGEPTLHITLAPNSSPFAGREATFGTSRQIEERLNRELETNLSLQVEKHMNTFVIRGRGELHLSILLETMRREGYEMEVGKPQVIVKTIDGIQKEPVEEVLMLIPNEFQGAVSQELGKRLGSLIHMESVSDTETELLYHIPSRATIGLRSLLITLTKGTLIYNAQVIDWQPIGRQLPKMRKGALIADQSGTALAYGLQNAQGRGTIFIEPGTNVYEGMIVGLNAKDEDISINVCKGKKLTNMRSKASDGNIQLTPPTVFSLEQSLDFLENDELLEITPQSLRLRKKYLTEIERKRQRNYTSGLKSI